MSGTTHDGSTHRSHKRPTATHGPETGKAKHHVYQSKYTISGANKIAGLKGFSCTLTDDFSGRAWTAAELRRKCFDDLHKLWYVLYKERNALLTHMAKSKRVSDREKTVAANLRLRKVKTSMSMILAVLGERQKAFKESRQGIRENITWVPRNEL